VSGRVLLVEDDREMCAVLEARLGRRGYEVAWRTSAQEAFDVLEEQDFDAVVTDLNMKGMNGLALCERVVANRPDVPVVVITAFGSMETAIAAIRSGAYDFINKPFDVEALDLTLQRALQHRSLREEVRRLRSAVAEATPPRVALGASPAMERLRKTVARVAASDAPVLLCGETGTGKELVARAIHEASERRAGPFVPVNCAAMPAPLLESELFGHARGAFTDATAQRRGLFQEAHGGTLFLDEVGDLALELQPKLLRAVEEGAVRPVGRDRAVRVDVRILAATHRDLEEAVEEGRFREDLFFRLDVLRIDIPPLRARGGDVLLLAQHFLERAARKLGKAVSGLSAPAAAHLSRYAWPGNVRELENAIERAVALTVTDRVVVEDLPERIRDYRCEDVLVASRDPSELVPLEEVERRYILRVLEAVGGNKALAARILGLDRKTLYRKLERYGSR
jgi:two-component system, NtrC family, response regulator AtoC